MKVKALAIGLGAVVVLAAAGGAGLDFYASQRAEEGAALVLDQLPPGVKATHGKVSCAWFCDPLTIEDVALTVDLPWVKRIHVGRITVSGASVGMWDLVRGRLPDAVGARSVVFEGVDYDLADGAQDTIERVELVEPRLEQRYDRRGGPWSLAKWLHVFSLASGEATNLHSKAVVETTEFETHTETRNVSAVKGGHLLSLTDHNTTVDVGEAGQGKLHADVADARLEDCDLVGLDKVLNPAEYGSARDLTFYTLIGNFTLSGVTAKLAMQQVPATLSLDSVSISGVQLRQSTLWLKEPQGELTPAEVRDFLQSFSLGGVELKKLSVAVQAPLFPVNAELGDFVLEMGKGRLEHSALDGVSFRMPGLVYSLGTASLDGLAIRVPAGFFDRDPKEWGEHPPGVPKLFFDRYHVADVKAQSPFAGSLSLKDITATMSGTVDKPTGARFDMSDLAIDLTMLALVKPMRNFGYRSVTFEAHAEAKYDYDAKTAELTEATFGAPEMGTLSANYRLSNFPFDTLQGITNPEAFGIAAGAIGIDGAALRYDDASLVDHLFAVAADNLHQTPEQARQTVIGMIEQQKADLSKTFLSGMPRVLDAFDQVIAFLREPKSIRLSVKPPGPISVAQLMLIGKEQPGKVLDLLGVTVDRP
ncbi:MAG TPA: hypothetical protein VLX85_11845 [Stellaceae bacterium]|nr:hypothetical protein [Stellaceae bacterium]